ncbi:hypothetical protein [Bacillus sp. 165]|uniref:hypothetical protein n=1 Tax=Bacillus sp. 165 TaxID=1529117 RepID=UPI001AD9694D|nr:hypothetical protein [Bacillus sp. 165]MBO9129393.1 hypothetical protein [Bacillus sp. 165]
MTNRGNAIFIFVCLLFVCSAISNIYALKKNSVYEKELSYQIANNLQVYINSLSHIVSTNAEILNAGKVSKMDSEYGASLRRDLMESMEHLIHTANALKLSTSDTEINVNALLYIASNNYFAQYVTLMEDSHSQTLILSKEQRDELKQHQEKLNNYHSIFGKYFDRDKLTNESFWDEYRGNALKRTDWVNMIVEINAGF